MGMAVLTRAEAYAKYADELVRFATGLTGPDDGPDLVAAAMVGVLRSSSWDAVRNERAYLYQAVVNEARRHYRKTMRRRAAECAADVGSGRVANPEVHPEVLQAVGRLSVRQRAVVFLAFWEDMRPVDIARRLGLSEGTVHRHLARAGRHLRRTLDE
jgi:RNA polymerase sigma factor (sigma-70 family)